MRKFILFATLLIVAGSSRADECADFNNSIDTVIYYVNGVDNTPVDMAKAALAIRGAVGNVTSNRFSIAENRSDGALKDFYQALKNRTNTVDPEQFWIDVRTNDPDKMSDEIKDLYAEAIASLAIMEISQSPDLQEMVADFLDDLSAGKKLVLVSHSQGNFFANAAYRYIVEFYPSYADSIGIVAVASPAPIVEGNGLLTQNAKDKVIFGIVSAAFQVLPANVDFTGEDSTNHGFLTTYMLPRNAKSRITNQINTAKQRLKPPVSSCDDSVAILEARPISNLTPTSVDLNASLVQGTNVDVWFVNRKNTSAISCSDYSATERVSVSAISEFSITLTGLDSKSSYYYKVCGEGSDGIIRSTPTKIYSTPSNNAKVSPPKLEDVTGNSMKLSATVLEGEFVNVGFVISEASLNSSHNCNIGRSGNLLSGDVAEFTFEDLKPDTSYKVSSCARAHDDFFGPHYGGERFYSTNSVPVLACSNQSFSGSSAGLAARVSLGENNGRSTILFNTFTIPDGLKIYRAGTNILLYTTNGLVSGSIQDSFLAAGSEQVDVIVTGNTNTNTVWELTIGCPQ